MSRIWYNSTDDSDFFYYFQQESVANKYCSIARSGGSIRICSSDRLSTCMINAAYRREKVKNHNAHLSQTPLESPGLLGYSTQTIKNYISNSCCCNWIWLHNYSTKSWLKSLNCLGFDMQNQNAKQNAKLNQKLQTMYFDNSYTNKITEKNYYYNLCTWHCTTVCLHTLSWSCGSPCSLPGGGAFLAGGYLLIHARTQNTVV